MSRLIDSLKKVSGVTSQPMGFGRAREEEVKTRILLIASVVPDKLNNNTENLAKVDAVVCRFTEIESGARSVKEINQVIPGVPCGLWPDTARSENIKIAADAAADFIVFPASAPLTAPGESKLGKVLVVSPAMDAVLLRPVNELPVDAVLVSAGQEKVAPLTYENLLFFRLCASLLEKPLMAAVQPDVSIDELQILWNAGISGVVMTIEDKSSVEKLVALYQEINKATFPSRRKGRKMEPTLPAVNVAAEETEGEEEEDE